MICPKNYIKLYAIIFIFILPIVCKAQDQFKIDSLKNIITTVENDSIIAEAYIDFFPIWIHVNLDSSRYYTHKGYQFAKQAGQSKGIADLAVYTAYVDMSRGEYKLAHNILDEAYRILKKKNNYKPGEFHILNWRSSAYFEEGKLDSAQYVLKEIIQTSAADFPQNTISAYFNLGDIATVERSFYDAIKNYQIADSLCEAYNKVDVLPACSSALANIGVIFKNELGNMDKALAYLKKARAKYLDNKNDFLVYDVDIELGEIYVKKKQYIEAEDVLKKSYAFFEAQNVPKKCIRALDALNKLYIDQGKPLRAAKGLDREYNLSIQEKDSFYLAGSLVNKGIVNLAQSNYIRAERHIQSGLDIAKQINNDKLKIRAYKALTDLYIKEKDYKNALEAQTNYNQLELRKQQEINESKLFDLETRYQFDKKEQEIQLLEAKNNIVEEEKKTQKIISFATTGILMLGVLSMFMMYVNRQKTAKKLKQLDALKTNFFSNLSHEFRTPLTLISGPIQNLLRKKHLSEQDQLELSFVERNTNRLRELVDQLLELTKLEVGDKSLSVGQYNLRVFINQLVEPFVYQAKQKEFQFSCVVAETGLVWFDYDVFYKILSNLFNNALKYTDRHGIINLAVRIQNKRAVVTVANTSSAVTAEDLKYVFNRFFQLNDNSEGVGIGLSLVKELVIVHKGKIEVSVNGEGQVVFSLSIPVNKASYTANEIVDGSTFSLKEKSVNKLKKSISKAVNKEGDDRPVMLVVDDNEDIRLFIEELHKNEFNIVKAKDGNEGALVALDIIPDIIICDIMMPDYDGMYLVNKLKNDARTSHVPIVLLTAKSGDQNEMKGMQEGADAYVEKPFKIDKLRTLVQNILHNRKLMHEHYKNTGVLCSPTIKLSSKDSEFVNRLQKITAQYLTEPNFGADKFSELMCMSRMQLHRKLKALTGQSTSGFIKFERLKAAKELLENNDVSVSEVAYSVGFNQPSYFTTCFKEAFGFSPSEIVSK